MIEVAPRAALTPTQQKVLDFMRAYLAEQDQMPSGSVISRRFGWKSGNAAFEVLTALWKKGVIERNAAGNYRFVRGVQG